MKPSEYTVCSYARELAGAAPGRKLLGDPSGWLTVRQARASALSVARQLLDAGIGPGDLVALQARRSIPAVLALLAIRRIGAAAVLTDPHEEPEKVLSECEAAIAVSAVLLVPDSGRLLLRRESGTMALTVSPAETVPELPACPEDARSPGYVIFTSGSTGKKKAVVLSDYCLVNNLLDSQPLGRYSEDDIALGALPLEHVFGLVLLAGAVVLRYAVYLPEDTDPDSILRDIQRERITRMNGVPSLYQAMAARKRNRRFPSLRAGFIGGAPIDEERFAQLERQLDMTLIPVYGMSECVGISCADGNASAEVRGRGVGKIYSMNTVKILAENGRELPCGETGEILVNGPSRMLGYWGNPLPADQFLPTGDLGSLDADGTLHIRGRIKELIIRNGRNISPRKIEEALISLPGVRDAVVLGMPDPQAGEVPIAMAAGILDPAELLPLLPKNELPVKIMCVEELPLTSAGKPDKTKIREVLSSWKNG